MAIDEQIAQLEQIMNTGATHISVDGVSTRFDLDQVRQRLRELYRCRERRGQAPTIRLDGGFPNY
jgi:hypothetical protein